MAQYFFKQSRQGKTELLEYILIDLQQHLVTVIKEKLVLLDLLLISSTDSGLEKHIPYNPAQPRPAPDTKQLLCTENPL